MREYDIDILISSDRKVELLRRMTVAEPVNQAPDWPNTIEEINSVGSKQRGADALRGLPDIIDVQASLSVLVVRPGILAELLSDKPAV